MTENNAAQPGLTDAEILHRWDIYVSEPCASYPLTDSDKLDFARAIESALLSKLRAEGVQAGDGVIIGRITVKGMGRSSVDLDASHADLPAGDYLIRAALASAPVAGEAQRPTLAVWYGSMPESNGKSNWTAILHRKGDGLMDGPHVTIDRSEYPDRVRYEADRVRYLIGEIDKEPWILDYDADKCDAAPQASEAVRNEALYLLREARALLPMFTTAEAIGDWSEKVNRFAAGRVIDAPPQADKDGGANTVNGKEFSGFANSENAGSGGCAKVESLQRYGFGYADDGNGGRYLSSLKRDDGAFLRRDEVLAALSPTQPSKDGGGDE